MQAVDIKVSHIQRELAKMQDHACLFNLVIYSQSEQRTAYLKEVIHSIVQKFPCRLLFIQGDPDATEHFFHASVTRGPHSCAQIDIKASCNELARVPYVVIPHLVTDLPLYLLWGEDPTEEKIILPHLKPFAQRLIFDAESSATRLKSFCEKILEQRSTFKVDIMDLNWAWISNWRDVLSQIFDTQDKIHHLETAHTLLIEYSQGEERAGKNSLPTQAIYLQGWLAAQLKWTFVSMDKQADTLLIKYHDSQGEHTVALCPKDVDDVPPGSLLSLEVTAANYPHYYIVRKNEGVVTVHVSTLSTCELPFTLALSNPRRGLSFLREIFYQHTSEHYQKMLQTVASIQWDKEHGKD